ncbi:MAG: nucleotide exchange factor GrpE [Tannerella sp.]|jgi:anaerobic ribonucleoside-triphosphate reductase activating protein|nr:nucleotide exchange factor GrpE [Tannerella sp.]
MLNSNEINEILNYQKKETIRLHFTRNDITNLGPGIRYGVWVQGCNKHCEGCLTPNAQPRDGGELVACDAIIHEIISSKNIQGITISGGEPVLQWKELYCIIRQVKQRNHKINVLLYTGYSWEDDIQPILKHCSSLYNLKEFQDFWDCLDYWIDGDYQADKDDEKGLRGSSNQQLYVNLPEDETGTRGLYRQQKGGTWINLIDNRVRSYPSKDKDPMCDFNTSQRNGIIRCDHDARYLIGIPNKEVLKTFNDMNDMNKKEKNKPGSSVNTNITQSTSEPQPVAEAEKNKAESELLQNEHNKSIKLINPDQNSKKQLQNINGALVTAQHTKSESTSEPQPVAKAEENKAEGESLQNKDIELDKQNKELRFQNLKKMYKNAAEKLEKLNADFKSLQKEYNELGTECENLQKQLDDTKRELTTVKNNQTELFSNNFSLQTKNKELSANNQRLCIQNNDLQSQLACAWNTNEASLSKNAGLQEQINKLDVELRQYKTAHDSSRREQEELVNYRKKNIDNLKFIINFCISLKKIAEKQSTEIEEQLLLSKKQKEKENELKKLSVLWESIIIKIDDFIKEWGFTPVRPQRGDTYNPNEHYIDNPSSTTTNVIEEVVSDGYKKDGIVIKPAVVRLLERDRNPAAKRTQQ